MRRFARVVHPTIAQVLVGRLLDESGYDGAVHHAAERHRPDEYRAVAATTMSAR
jgi:hypothetical protein